jgi:hypothetical protein
MIVVNAVLLAVIVAPKMSLSIRSLAIYPSPCSGADSSRQKTAYRIVKLLSVVVVRNGYLPIPLIPFLNRIVKHHIRIGLEIVISKRINLILHF